MEELNKQKRIIQSIKDGIQSLRENKYFGKVILIMENGNIVHIKKEEDVKPEKWADTYRPRKLIVVTKNQQDGKEKKKEVDFNGD